MAEDLLSKYLDKTITREELNRLYAQSKQEGGMDESLRALWTQVEKDKAPDMGWDDLFENLLKEAEGKQAVAPVHKVHFLKRYRWVAAASILILFTGTWLIIQNSKPNIQNIALTQAQRFKNDVQPGREGAILKLSDGREILLDTVKNGEVVPGFTKTAKGLVIEKSTVQYATVIVPKAKTEKLELNDGTVVWLNAGSTITFPTVFAGAVREVSMTGEAYFEVAKNEAKHFFVQTKTDRIEVKGTHFNISAYGEVKTTLLEGKVQIGNTMLQPGEQYDNGKVTQPDMEEVMAWKNGMFRYNGTDLKEIMAQVERWYDVKVIFEGDVTNLHFTGGVERTANVSLLLKKLELTGGVEFTIEGKTITIKPI